LSTCADATGCSREGAERLKADAGLGKLYDYDLILLDLNLPDMSGYEVLRTLRVTKVKTPILRRKRSGSSIAAVKASAVN
jgi:DNA-binding response OmpR family regulator